MQILVLFALAAAAVMAEPPQIPSDIRAQLDKKYPGWTLAKVDSKIEAWFREYKFTYAPNLLIGDFDGDGKKDYAIRLESAGKDVTIAFVDRGAHFESSVLSTDEADPFTFLLLYEKGSKDFDFTTLKPFRHKTDAIGLMYFQKTPFTFIHRKGGFRRMLSLSDEDLE